ncbi:MAG: aspartate carbamoyltransferase [Kiritimatiellae bacterium]|nr:aspartate carbamoyltransferase [Kiritimatiellia bacterium]
MPDLRSITWEDFQRLESEQKCAYLRLNDRPYHVLFAQQFSRRELDHLGHLATRIRFIAKNKAGMIFLQDLLCHRRAMLYFSQPSTRTFLSFCAACEILGLKIGEVRDTTTSSELKGESREDSVRTFSSYFDLIIMRSEIGGLAERMAWVLSNSERPVPIINAGSGKDQHPTQALLDIYTLQRSFEKRGGIDGKTILFVGDLARGRTVRSLSLLLRNYRQVRQIFAAPDSLQIGRDILEQLEKAGVEYTLTSDFHGMIPCADAIYMTRVQDEWDSVKGESRHCEVERYWFTAEHLRLLKPDAVIMHPFPRRKEISPDVDHDPRAVYWRQMRNGMWIRTALIAFIFRVDDEILKYDAPDS